MTGKNGNMVSVEEAVNLILSSIRPLGGEKVSIFQALGRVLYEDIIAGIDIPPSDNSAMDGYAIHAADTSGATKTAPVRLGISDEARAGGVHMPGPLADGKAIRIMTGAPVPREADAVVQFEDTREEGESVLIYRPVQEGENIRRAGEDIGKGNRVLRAGDRITSADTGLLASLDYREVSVARMPEVAIISTGDEIAEVGEPILPGMIRNSNAYTLYSEVKKYCGLPRYLGISGDSLDDTVRRLSQAMECDVIVTTGGVSMGRYDFVKDALRELGVEILIENIRMKPGKPCVFGRKGPVLFFGLPGNPVSTMVSFIQFVRPAILRLMGARIVNKPLVHALLREEITKKAGRTHFIRGYYTVEGGELHVSTTGPQGSGILRSMSIANCLIVVPEQVERIGAGERVAIQLIRHEEI